MAVQSHRTDKRDAPHFICILTIRSKGQWKSRIMEEQVYQAPKVEIVELATESNTMQYGSGGDLGGGDA